MLRKLKIQLLILCSSMMTSGTVGANDATSPVWGLDTMYLSIFGGGSFHHDIKHGYTHVNSAQNGNSTHGLDGGYIFGAAIGAHTHPNIRTELELSHSRNLVNSQSFDNPIFATSSGSASGHVLTTNLMLNSWYEFEGLDYLKPYVGGGAGISFVNATSLLDGGIAHEFDNTTTAFSFQAGLGSSLKLTDSVNLDLGYRFRGIPNVTLKSGIAGQINKSAGLYSHSLQIGVSFKLNGD